MEDTLRWITFGLAVLGAALGVFNTVVAFRRGRARFSARVEYHLDSTGRPRAYAQLVNMGQVTVTVSELYLTGGRSDRKRKWHVSQYERGGRTFPITLQPFAHETGLMLFVGSIEDAAIDGASVLRGTTAQGKRFKGTFTGFLEASRGTFRAWDGKRPMAPSLKAALDKLSLESDADHADRGVGESGSESGGP